MRRLDIEQVLDRVPAPEIQVGGHLLEILFKVGPTRGEGPLYEQDLEAWERRRGIELAPWQADLLLDLSRAYLAESYTAREWAALAPWPPARNMWKYVQDQLRGPALQAGLQEPVRIKHGNRQ